MGTNKNRGKSRKLEWKQAWNRVVKNTVNNKATKILVNSRRYMGEVVVWSPGGIYFGRIPHCIQYLF